MGDKAGDFGFLNMTLCLYKDSENVVILLMLTNHVPLEIRDAGVVIRLWKSQCYPLKFHVMLEMICHTNRLLAKIVISEKWHRYPHIEICVAKYLSHLSKIST